MRAQIFLSVNGVKHLIAKALTEYIDFSKRVYIAYGSTNEYLLYHLGVKTDKSYMAGCNVNCSFNVTKDRNGPIVLQNSKIIDIKDFEISKDDVFIKGANALWYENGKKQTAVAAADKNGGTFGNFYVKAVCRGAKVIIPVSHEKLIPYFVETSQNVDFSTGSKIAMLRLFSGEVFSEIEAFEVLFGLKAEIILAGGLNESQGGIGFLVEGERVKEALEFANRYNKMDVLKKAEFIY